MRAVTAHPFAEYLRTITEYNEAVLTLPVQGLLVAVVAWTALRWRRIDPGARVLVVACAVAALGCIALYAVRAAGWIGLLAFLAAGAALSTQGVRRWRWPLALSLAALCVASHVLLLLDFALRRFPDPAVWRAARETAAASGKRLMVDWSTARYVFDYRFPPDTRYAGLTSVTDRQPNEVRVVSARSVSLGIVERPALYNESPGLRVGGHEFHSIAQCPDMLVILPAASP